MPDHTAALSRDDLRAAVSAGVLSERQAANLTSLADSRRGARENLAPGDEPFELFKGFNEIFIVTGLVILGSGWTSLAILWVAGSDGGWFTRAAMAGAATCVIIWLLSEYFVRRRRMVAPAIALSVAFAGAAVLTISARFAQPFMVAQEDYSSLPGPMALATLALGIYWLRFRVPFTMAMMALGLFATALIFTAAQAGTPTSVEDLFLLSGDGPFAVVTLGVGVAVFAVAMVFDMSDPHRVTRRSANGFWLHLIAAPALVNTVALTLLSREDQTGNLLLVAFLLVLALLAIVIDRRSFLIAGVGYSVLLSATVFGGEGGALTVLILGALLVILGAFWERIRAVILRGLAPILPLDRLPPSMG